MIRIKPPTTRVNHAMAIFYTDRHTLGKQLCRGTGEVLFDIR